MDQPKTIPKWQSRSATACAWLVAAVFLLTGLAKAYDLYGFIEKATYYRAVPTSWIRPAALATITLELVLAVLLAFRVWPRAIALASVVVIAGFSALIAHAWRAYGIEDCGCLGVLADTPPGASLAKNGIMVLALGWYAWRSVPSKDGGRPWRLFVGASASLGAGAVWMLSSQL